ncbi:MAG: shikimate kinase [Clostridiales bacterium]|nr:shikimate kinase [Clostridiales bacterium]
MKNILLIGFMGTGKTTVSRQLSLITGMEEIDMDAYIVKHENLSISDIFDRFGEDYFRDKETQYLKEILRNKDVIVSCGGGVVVRDENVEYMKGAGTIVLLNAKPETIYARVKDSKERPILNGNMNIEYIRQLMNRRKERYLSVADIIVETDNKSAMDIAKEIVKKIS